MHTVKQRAFLKHFSCLGSDCPDTCCRGWGMQVDQATCARYEKEAPELVDLVVKEGDHTVMKRDEETDYCTQFSDGLCNIHAKRGTDFLGDACHFFPRILRKFGEEVTMSAALSCPEVCRLIVTEENPWELSEVATDRLPFTIKDYGEEALSPEDMIAVMEAFISTVENDAITPEYAIMAIANVAQSLEYIDKTQWKAASSFYLSSVESRLLPGEIERLDPYRLLQGLALLIKASPAIERPKLEALVAQMATALGVQIHWETVELAVGQRGFDEYKTVQERWKEHGEKALSPVLKRWIQAQLAMMSFPFSGLGHTVKDKATLLAVRFATLRLALMSQIGENGELPDEQTVVTTLYTLSRFMDHLADPALSMTIYEDAGWLSEGRLRGLLEDAA